MDALLQFDTELFLKIHLGLTNTFFDFLMPLLRKPTFWIPLYAFIVIYSIAAYKKKGVFIIVMILVTFAIGDLTASRLIKKNVKRIRPCNEVALSNQIVHRVACGTGYSFPSSHATNHFAIAVFLIGTFYRRWKPVVPLAILWAASISFAQVYVGVHYPIDVTCGAILGILIGLLTTFIYKKYQHKF